MQSKYQLEMMPDKSVRTIFQTSQILMQELRNHYNRLFDEPDSELTYVGDLADNLRDLTYIIHRVP